MKDLHVDIETFSKVDIKECGHHRYIDDKSFEILIVSYGIDDGPITHFCPVLGEDFPDDFIEAIATPSVRKHAHNASFERTAFNKYGILTDPGEWVCSAVKARACGLPGDLKSLSKILKLGDDGKDKAGAALIRFFSVPQRPTKKNGMKTRMYPEDDMEKWEAFCSYCDQDVVAEKGVERELSKYKTTKLDQYLYALDQKINDNGIFIDKGLARAAKKMAEEAKEELISAMNAITGLENSNAPVQLARWLTEVTGDKIGSVNKKVVAHLRETCDNKTVLKVLKLRAEAGQTAASKYKKMLDYVCSDGRARGTLLFNGAGRTGRWAGRGIQVQNMLRIKEDDIDVAREMVRTGSLKLIKAMYGRPMSIVGQCVRTALIAAPGTELAVADFSAIEARVAAWVADERWRIELFENGGDIYIESYARLAGKKPDDVSKEERGKGKILELACGYGGSVGAMKQFGADKLGLSDARLKEDVRQWREASPNIVAAWWELDRAAKKAIARKGTVIKTNLKGVGFLHDGFALRMKLPSGRELFYKNAKIRPGKFDKPVITFEGEDQETKRWGWIETYGPKIFENLVQAISRDVLGVAMLRMDAAGMKILMHVHDEAINETLYGEGERTLQKMRTIMAEPIRWAAGLPLNAEGYHSEFYKKD